MLCSVGNTTIALPIQKGLSSKLIHSFAKKHPGLLQKINYSCRILRGPKIAYASACKGLQIAAKHETAAASTSILWVQHPDLSRRASPSFSFIPRQQPRQDVQPAIAVFRGLCISAKGYKRRSALSANQLGVRWGNLAFMSAECLQFLVGLSHDEYVSGEPGSRDQQAIWVGCSSASTP